MCGVHRGTRQPSVVEYQIVFERLAQIVVLRFVGFENYLLLLVGSEGLDEAEAESLFILQNRGSFVLARGGDDGFGAEEGGGHHDLVAQDEVVDD